MRSANKSLEKKNFHRVENVIKHEIKRSSQLRTLLFKLVVENRTSKKFILSCLLVPDRGIVNGIVLTVSAGVLYSQFRSVEI